MALVNAKAARQALAEGGRGAAYGMAATAVMTGWMLLAKKMGLMGQLPPEKITENFLRYLGVRPRTPLREAATTAGHFGYGAGLGTLFQLGGRVIPGPAPLRGALFGAAVWAVSYAGWLPAVGLMPPPDLDRPGRQAATLIGHLIFGAVLGGLASRRA
jgi:hypothetical protein